MKLFFLIMMILSCSHPQDQKPTEPATPPIAKKWHDVADRMLTMADHGWIVSRYDDGRLEHTGDSLLWTGIAMGALDCASAKAPEAALLAMLAETSGKLWRHPSIPDDWSLDGAIGFYYGIVQHAARCPETRSAWVAPLTAHAAAVAGDARLTPRFEVLLKAALAAVAGGAAPSESDRGELGAEVAAWALPVVEAKAAAFRLHLGWLTLRVIDAPKARDLYCGTVGPAAMPLLENYCGRPGLKAWEDGFRYDVMEYRHQRAMWEAEAVPADLHTPGLDELVALRELYTESELPR